MMVDQLIYTSLSRLGAAGYHIAARSAGVRDAEAVAVQSWSPSHGSLLTDKHNAWSVHFHALPGDRRALGRTCEGPPEYSGREGRQLYTHVLLLGAESLEPTGWNPLEILRDALALGRLNYQADPASALEKAELCDHLPCQDSDSWDRKCAAVDARVLDGIVAEVLAGRPVRCEYAGDRIALAECVIGRLPIELRRTFSFSTSLAASTARPFKLVLLPSAKH